MLFEMAKVMGSKEVLGALLGREYSFADSAAILPSCEGRIPDGLEGEAALWKLLVPSPSKRPCAASICRHLNAALGGDKSYSILKRGCLVQINLFGHPSPSSVNSQGSSDLNSRMRIILFDWIATVALKFDYSADTAITTMRIVDQYTKVRPVPRRSTKLPALRRL